MDIRRSFYALAAGILTIHSTAAAATCEAQSGDTTVPLLELYTSEGCDSCPPADRWLAELPNKGFGKDRVVPLAFHVDYWNYLGWADPFAQATFSQRQREFAHRTEAATVYTPEFVLNGREYRRWTKNDFEKELQQLNRISPRADISLKLQRAGSMLQIDGVAVPRDKKSRAELYVALYENNLRSEVKAGENRGHTLQHAFAVRHLIGPIATDGAGKMRLQKTVALEPGWKITDLGVAAFVQTLAGTDVLQSLALPVCSQ